MAVNRMLVGAAFCLVAVLFSQAFLQADAMIGSPETAPAYAPMTPPMYAPEMAPEMAPLSPPIYAPEMAPMMAPPVYAPEMSPMASPMANGPSTMAPGPAAMSSSGSTNVVSTFAVLMGFALYFLY